MSFGEFRHYVFLKPSLVMLLIWNAEQIFGTTECFTVAFVSVKKRPKKYLQRPKKGIEDLCIGATEEKKLQKQSERKKALPENVYCNFFL